MELLELLLHPLLCLFVPTVADDHGAARMPTMSLVSSVAALTATLVATLVASMMASTLPPMVAAVVAIRRVAPLYATTAVAVATMAWRAVATRARIEQEVRWRVGDSAEELGHVHSGRRRRDPAVATTQRREVAIAVTVRGRSRQRRMESPPEVLSMLRWSLLLRLLLTAPLVCMSEGARGPIATVPAPPPPRVAVVAPVIVV